MLEKKSDKYKNFKELIENESMGIDYNIDCKDRHSDLVILAIHGGKIEPGTSQIAKAAADEWLDSYYCFEGIKPSGNFDLHITSTNFDEPAALALVSYHEHAVSIHGYKDDEEKCTIVGGRDIQLRDAIVKSLNEYGFKAVAATDRFAGKEETNIVNRCRTGMGVQLEISSAQRAALFSDSENTEPNDELGLYISAMGEGLVFM